MGGINAAFFLAVFCIASAFAPGSYSFEESQKNFERVSDAYSRKEEYVKMKCRSKEIPEETFGNVFIRAFKAEETMELWVQKPDGKYIKFNEFKVYAMSGTLGPKRQQGDCQVPEGYYYIDDFNPVSSYHLSLGISYPNESDMILSSASHKGGDIYIHGGKASAGCLAMSNYYIEDIYICAVKARTNGQIKIPVLIYPFKMTTENMQHYARFPQFSRNLKLWNNLATGYQMFEKTNRLPEFYVAADGYYKFIDPASVSASSK
ncbi:MAG TPA: L,D-transpeptidase family protein [Chitinophagales bacterium]|nr:L,D-transpeptidase family protein [Chitinophagales bacterium]